MRILCSLYLHGLFSLNRRVQKKMYMRRRMHSGAKKFGAPGRFRQLTDQLLLIEYLGIALDKLNKELSISALCGRSNYTRDAAVRSVEAAIEALYCILLFTKGSNADKAIL